MKVSGTIAAGILLLSAFTARPAFSGPLEDIFAPADPDSVLPIERILDQARAAVPGRIVEVELENERGRLIYEVQVLTGDNRKVEIEFDAKTGAELSRSVKKSKRAI